MMVPRSFNYKTAPPMKPWDEKSVSPDRERKTKSWMQRNRITSAPRPVSPARTNTEPERAPTQPMSVPKPERTRSAEPMSLPIVDKSTATGRRKPSNHDPNALPPAVAALLAVTQIPRPTKNQFQRRRSANPRRISLDELVNEWKNDDSLISSSSGSLALGILLEDPQEPCPTPAESIPEESFLYTRSTSAESVPSLDADDQSILSSESLSTPPSLRSRKSIQNLKKDKSKSLPRSEECASDHPLVPTQEDPDEDLILAISSPDRSKTPKPKPSFKSNLTSSLQALKNVAISSITSLTTTTPPQRNKLFIMPDDALWSHPFLFPQFAPEVRPAITGTPTQAQRRYLNPPLTFEELETPYQLALHAPYLNQDTDDGPSIQMQTHGRAKRKSSARRAQSPSPSLDSTSEAGKVLRMREVRENPDFLRAIACELNMKRVGKLAYPKVKFWLPPRQVGAFTGELEGGKIPKRWIGESAY